MVWQVGGSGGGDLVLVEAGKTAEAVAVAVEEERRGGGEKGED